MDIRKNKHYEVLQGRLVFNFGKLKVTVGDVVELGQEDIDNGYDIDSLVTTGFLKEVRKPRKKKTDEIKEGK
jgi:hypothetical protein|tara:strand:+ start:1283 stop:1498 length:216 start_codon:yes stop_codon:yes gene_type:complete